MEISLVDDTNIFECQGVSVKNHKAIFDGGQTGQYVVEMSKGKDQRLTQVRELIFAGYTQDKIAQKLNVSKRTIARDMKKIKISGEQWIDNLMNYDIVDKVRMTLEGFDHDRTRLEELYQKTDDDALKLKIIESTHKNRVLSLGLLIHTPAVWGMSMISRRYNPKIARPKTMVDRLGLQNTSDEVKPYNKL